MSLLILVKDHAYVRDVFVHPDDTPLFDEAAKEELDKQLREEGKAGVYEKIELRHLGGRRKKEA